jgi:CRP-like cAMP-binding protein
MGAGASTVLPDQIKKELKDQMKFSETKDWQECTGMKPEDALAELKRLRKLGYAACSNPLAGQKKGGARGAVHDKGASDVQLVEHAKSADEAAKIKAAIKDNILFKTVKSEEELRTLILYFKPETVADGTKIITEGTEGKEFYVITKGKITITVGGSEVGDVGNKDKPCVGTFGELALMYGTPRAATCTADGACDLYSIHRDVFRKVLNNASAQRSEKYVELVKEVTISEGNVSKKLSDVLTKTELLHIADALEQEKFSAGAQIIRQGEAGDFFYIIESGKVDVEIDKKKVTTLEAGGFFGEKALLKEDVRAATCRAAGPVTCLSLGREDFLMMLGSVGDLLAGKKEEEAVTGGGGAERTDAKIGLDDLDVKKTLGHGAFGRVKLVKLKSSKETYALKCQGKKAIVDNCLQDHVLMERKILMMLDHPFILKLVSACQDPKYVYFILEILLGGELFTWLRKNGRFEEAASKFYSAQVVLAFQHMHAKKVAYRDLKPENLVLDSNGYLKVVDLGLAKIVDGKTWTLCGTPDYLAPEIILNEGHDKAVDYWALGVLMYELVAGIPPFYADDPMEVYEKILSSNMTFPQHFTKNLCDIVRKLLKLCQSKRLGNGKGGCNGIIKHKWFSGFGWDDLLAFNLPTPIAVKVKDGDDTSNFDNYDEEVDDTPACEWNPEL